MWQGPVGLTRFSRQQRPVPDPPASECPPQGCTLKQRQPQLDGASGRNIWIVKPSCLSRGRGIALFNDLPGIRSYTRSSERQEAAEELLEERPWEDGTSINNHSWIVQKYIENPLIIRNKKFDIRQWVLVTSIHPLKVWFYDRCYLRFCSLDYSDDISQVFGHLTNNSVQKHSNKDLEPEDIEGNMWHSEVFQQHLHETWGRDAWKETVQPQMKRIAAWALKGSQGGFKNVRPKCFEVFGFDFMVDQDLGVWLLEVNLTPDMSHSTPVTAKLVHEMVEDTAKVIVDCQETGMRCVGEEDMQAEEEEEEEEEDDDDDASSGEEEGQADDAADESGYCSFDDDFVYCPPTDTGDWVCIHRGKAKGWNFADFLEREAALASRKKSRKSAYAGECQNVLPR